MSENKSTALEIYDKVTVKAIQFAPSPFRKLGNNLSIPFSERLTLIAGHNGIGKSTILALVANTFGITDINHLKSYFDESFYSNIENMIYISLDEVAQITADSSPIVIAEIGKHEIHKRCSLTKRSKWKRARVVPRTKSMSGDINCGKDAKIPWPTLYLGLKRFASVGEAGEKEVSSVESDMHLEDRKWMRDFVNAVIVGNEVSDQVTKQHIAGLQKRSSQPGYSHHAFAVSMGQDPYGS